MPIGQHFHGWIYEDGRRKSDPETIWEKVDTTQVKAVKNHFIRPGLIVPIFSTDLYELAEETIP